METPKIEASARFEKSPALILVDLELSEAEMKAFENLKIEQELDLDYYGKVTDLTPDRIAQGLKAAGNNPEEVLSTAAHVIWRLAQKVAKDTEKTAVWLAVRLSLPSDSFTIPRWHQDGPYFNNQAPDEVIYKFVATPKGDQTLFGQSKDDDRYRQLEKIETDLYDKVDIKHTDPEVQGVRQSLDRLIERDQPLVYGQGAYFIANGPNSKIHSEPSITIPRLFVSVLAESEDRISDLERRWADNWSTKNAPGRGVFRASGRECSTVTLLPR